MPRTDGWRRRALPALLGALLLLAPLVVAEHVHADGAGASTSCLVCTVGDHGASEVPAVQHVGSASRGVLAPVPAAPAPAPARPLAASPSRGPPAPAPSSRH